MPSEISRVQSQNIGLNSWFSQPDTARTKVMKIALLVFGCGLMICPFFISNLAKRLITSLVFSGALLTFGISCDLFARSFFNSYTSSETLAAIENTDFQASQSSSPNREVALFAFDSSRLETIPFERAIACRSDFLKTPLDGRFIPAAPMIAKSNFVSNEMVEHLMRGKKDLALGVKYQRHDNITNMEGALHSFVTPVSSILITGDFRWMGKATGHLFGENRFRRIILSSQINPDFEFDSVVMRLVQIENEPVIGAALDPNEKIPSSSEKEDDNFRRQYDEKLRKHMIYHLSPQHRLPSLSEISADKIMSQNQTKEYLEHLILNPEIPRDLNRFMRVDGGPLISLEVLFEIYVEQMRNEFKAINPNAPAGYVYTIDPPSIFSNALGGPVKGTEILNRLQALSFQTLKSENLYSNMKLLAISDFSDKAIPPLLAKALQVIRVVSKDELYDERGNYQGPNNLALVMHNNSDGFGQNIEFEGLSSLDGLIGYYSNAALALRRERGDLVHSICN